MKKFIILLASLFIIVMAGCSNGKEEPIEVTFQISEKIKVNEEITMEALVIQGEEKLADVDHVQFEIKKSGQKEPVMVNGIYKGNGLYRGNYTFKEEGTYTVISHVMVRSQMIMPDKEVTVEKAGNTVEEQK
ncbi:FixH family protein [Metabacillus fastidiosus]|uniref:FixH family protein n=1 Tax=Metabacillus fastidiosus TaxID=1458 RepID=A0ABU6NYT9_9BACI|nr:FixH family protein [Metabacillus fastidiosus]MED4402276.1 FixH family protein [Metabacillus fastidiosus]MED4462147.1 FixH family protein [Metabacillus fastidiosus]